MATKPRTYVLINAIVDARHSHITPFPGTVNKVEIDIQPANLSMGRSGKVARHGQGHPRPSMKVVSGTIHFSTEIFSKCGIFFVPGNHASNSPQFASNSPQKHHTFTTRKHAFSQNTPQKTSAKSQKTSASALPSFFRKYGTNRIESNADKREKPSKDSSANRAKVLPMPQERILVVDDEESVRSVVAALLERSGYAATTTESAEAAIARLQQDPDYDLVLSDIMMPGTDGLTLLDHICTDHPGMPVVMLSALNDVHVVTNAFRRGAVDYLLKPFERAELESIVMRAIEHGRLRKQNTIYRQNLESIVSTRTGRLRSTMQDLERSYDITLEAMGDALDLRDEETEGHSRRVTAYTIALAQAMGTGIRRAANHRTRSLPPRHRQDRNPRQHPPEVRQVERRRDGHHERALQTRLRDGAQNPLPARRRRDRPTPIRNASTATATRAVFAKKRSLSARESSLSPIRSTQ